MKKTTLQIVTAICLMVFSAYHLNAQKISWGEKLSISGGYQPHILGEDEKHFYTASFVKSDFCIEKFEKGNNRKIFSRKIKLPKNEITEEIVFADNKFILFVSYYDKKQDETIIYANTYSAENGKEIRSGEKFLHVPVEKKRRKGSFNVTVAPDSKRIMVTHIAYYKKQKKYREKFLLLDSELKKITERVDVTDDSEATNYTSDGLIIDSDGSFYYIKTFKDGRRSIVSYDANRDYEKWEEFIDIKKLGLPVKCVIYNMSCATTKKKDIVLVGYYSGDRKHLDGAFYLKIDHKSKEIVITKVNEFDKAFKDQFLTKRDIKKGREAEVDTKFGQLVLHKKSDGGLIGIGEVFQHWHTYTRNGEHERFVYGDLITINLSAEGDLLWADRIKKAQTFWYDSNGPFIFSSVGFRFFLISYKPLDYMSYFAALTDNKLYIAFNDNPKNIQKKSDQDKLKMFRNPNKAVMTLYSIDMKTGVKNKAAFFGGKDYEVVVEPRTAFQSEQNSKLLLMGSKGKKYKFGIMDYKNMED